MRVLRWWLTSWDAPLHGSGSDNHVDLDAGAERQCCDGNGRAGGVGLREMSRVNPVDLCEIAHAGQEHADAYNVTEALARGFQTGREIQKELRGLGFDAA